MKSFIPSPARYDKTVTKFSIIIPTSKHALELEELINSILNNVPRDISTEIIIIMQPPHLQPLGGLYKRRPDNPNESYFRTKKPAELISIKIVHKNLANQRMSAILDEINNSSGENIILMNDDFSHPPDLIPRMMNETLNNHGTMVVGSRYVEGGEVVGRSLIRKLLSRTAVKIAEYVFKITIKDPNSGFIAFPKSIISNIPIDANGYALSLEMLVKIKVLNVVEIPYKFVETNNRRSSLFSAILAYCKSVCHLYKKGPKSTTRTKTIKYNKSALFLSKAGRFYTVGASGLLINYLISSLISNGVISGLWYLQATLVGILISMSTNFILNKVWTFEDKNFSINHTLRQFLLFVGVSSFGAIIQLGLVYVMVEAGFRYELSLLFAVSVASISNFLLNKKLTFKDKIWG